MLTSVLEFLREGGFEVETAAYKSYRQEPSLSVPLWALAFRVPRTAPTERYGCPAHDIGVRLPELEWAHYLPTRLWRDAMERSDVHLTVSGSVLAAGPIVESGRRCLAWVATPYWGDRCDRIRTFPPLRRVVDACFDAPVCRRWERRLLSRASVLALSGYTERTLRSIAPRASIRRMYMPIRTDWFYPGGESLCRAHVGFSARYNDARKNVPLLLEAVALAVRRLPELSLTVVGADPPGAILRLAEALGIRERCTFLDALPREELGEFYRSLDVFVIPSFQEGLGIVGLEAMACGCPVVSTRCGGPEDYVKDGETGFLTDFSAQQMADAIEQVVSNRSLRQRMSAAAIESVRRDFSREAVRSVFWAAFNETFPSSGMMSA